VEQDKTRMSRWSHARLRASSHPWSDEAGRSSWMRRTWWPSVRGGVDENWSAVYFVVYPS